MYICEYSLTDLIFYDPPNVNLATWSVFLELVLMKPRCCNSCTTLANFACCTWSGTSWSSWPPVEIVFQHINQSYKLMSFWHSKWSLYPMHMSGKAGDISPRSCILRSVLSRYSHGSVRAVWRAALGAPTRCLLTAPGAENKNISLRGGWKHAGILQSNSFY